MSQKAQTAVREPKKAVVEDGDDELVDEQAIIALNLASRIVFLSGTVNEQSITGVIQQLFLLASLNSEPIRLVLSTYGGSADEMFALYDVMKHLRIPIHTVGLGKVMSAGVLLLAAGERGHRMVGASSRVMLHVASGHASGNVFEIDVAIREHKRTQQRLVSRLAAETQNSRRAIHEEFMNSTLDSYLTPAQAIKWGIADKIIGAPVRARKK